MNRGILLNRTMSNISLLPDWRLKEVSDYVDFLLKSFDNKEITEGIMKLVSESKSFDFLNDEEEIYDETDIIDVVSNPEFLKEGAAIDDFMHPGLVGTSSLLGSATLDYSGV